ncbi:hypothetical protein JL36_06445 [Lactococcus cremoris]|nr:hypothetical protein JL36_06445 [Lactococcus cremoris]
MNHLISPGAIHKSGQKIVCLICLNLRQKMKGLLMSGFNGVTTEEFQKQSLGQPLPTGKTN